MEDQGLKPFVLGLGVCALCDVAEAEGDLCPWMLQPEENGVVQGLLWSAVSSVRNKS